MPLPPAERELARLAADLGAADAGGPLSTAEACLVAEAESLPRTIASHVASVRSAILAGADPLGDALCRARPPARRRDLGAFYTQPALVAPMLDWVLARQPSRLIDAGCGSGRFAAGALRRQPMLAVVAVDIDPLATMLTRAAFAVLGVRKATVIQADYTSVQLPASSGRTAFIGNPPYVRHHGLTLSTKLWAAEAGRRIGRRVSALAGLHAYFFLATALHARPGDIGCFITSAEWLDVNYGSIIRDLLCNHLGGQVLQVIDPKAVPFEDAMTTAAIACFEVGAISRTMRVRLVDSAGDLGSLDQGDPLDRRALMQERRWTPLLRMAANDGAEPGAVPLRMLARVHRGAVTGSNDFFVLTREKARFLGIEQWCKPAITTAKEILDSGGIVRDGPERRLVLNAPPDVDRAAHPVLDRYLRMGEQRTAGGAAVSEGYIATHRRPWWNLGLSKSPPIVATYMARQAPVFALNPDGLALINIAHGIYPYDRSSPDWLARLVGALNASRESFRGSGRTYHGGLEKFEPREMEALLLPGLFGQDR